MSAAAPMDHRARSDARCRPDDERRPRTGADAQRHVIHGGGVTAGLRVAIFDRSVRDPERATGPPTCTIVASPVDVPIVEHLVGALADAALQAWPSWWGADARTSTAGVVRLGRAALNPSAAPWVEAAAQLAATGRRPMLDDAPRA